MGLNAVYPWHQMNEESQIPYAIEDFKTDSDELEEVLDRYDLDESLEREFNALDAQFRDLQIKYQSLLNSRRFLNGTQS
jgi:hypothetical protein